MKIYLFIACLFVPALLDAAGRPPPAPQDIPFVQEQGNKLAYRAVEDDHGGFYIIWTRTAGGAYSLMGQHMTDTGIPSWPVPGLLLAAHIDDTAHWDVWADGKGRLAVSWIDQAHVRAQCFASEDGRPAWSSGTLSVSISSQAAPSGTADVAGGAFIAWSERSLPDRAVLMVQHVDASGKPLWSNIGQRVSLRPSDQHRPAIVFDGQGGAIVAWKDFRADASQMMAQRLDYQGTLLWGKEGIVITAPANTLEQRPTLATPGSGEVVCVWAGSDQGTSHLRLQRVNAAGKLMWAPEGVVVSYGSWDQWNPYVIGDGANGIWVGWEDYRDGHNWKVYMLDLSATGQSAWTTGELRLAMTPGNQGRFYITDDGNKGFLAAWIDDRTGYPQIYLQEVNPQGQRLLGEGGLTISGPMKDPQKPHMAALGAGHAGLIWADRIDKNNWALYWRRVQGSVSPKGPENENPVPSSPPTLPPANTLYP